MEKPVTITLSAEDAMFAAKLLRSAAARCEETYTVEAQTAAHNAREIAHRLVHALLADR